MRRKQKRAAPTQTRLDAVSDTIRQRYLADQVGVASLAAELGTSVRTLAKWLDRNGIPRRDREQAAELRHQAFLESRAETHAEIIRLRTDEGLNLQAIAQRLEVSQRTVSTVLDEANLTRRLQPSLKMLKPPKSPRGVEKLQTLRPEVEAAIEEGLSGRELALRFTVCEKSVHAWVRQTGLLLRPLTPMQRDIVRLFQTTDMNRNAISKTVGCSRQFVTDTLRKVALAEPSGAMGRPPGTTQGKRDAPTGADARRDRKRQAERTEMMARVVELWQTTDLNLPAIATAVERSRSYVSGILRDLGIRQPGAAIGRPPGSVRGKRIEPPRQCARLDILDQGRP